jgi:SAM-dependent methyltransferase
LTRSGPTDLPAGTRVLLFKPNAEVFNKRMSNAMRESHSTAMRMQFKRLVKNVLRRVPVARRLLRERDQFRLERDHLLRERDHLLRERDELQIIGKASELDRSLYPHPPKHRPRLAFHRNIFRYLSSFANNESHRILEIGSRAVVSDSAWRDWIPNSDYVGFDVLAGKNVDVVGDAHRLSECFEPESFDIVVSLAVFEHFAMPWIVAEEITKVLKLGGLVIIETHFCYGEHELPWHFFNFHKNGLECLFNRGLGYEIVDSGMDNPMVGRFAFDASDYLRGRSTRDLYCHSSIIARKIRRLPFDGIDPWRRSYVEAIRGTMYPSDTGLSSSAPPA